MSEMQSRKYKIFGLISFHTVAFETLQVGDVTGLELALYLFHYEKHER
jgi:hypothetical protein